jgi:hypothetical protein
MRTGGEKSIYVGGKMLVSVLNRFAVAKHPMIGFVISAGKINCYDGILPLYTYTCFDDIL